MIHRDPTPVPGAWRVPLAAAVIFILLVVSTMDYHDSQRQADHCREMVEAGHWPEEVCDE